MKFFFPLGFRYGQDGGDLNSSVHYVYGPYEDNKAVEEALCRLWPNDKKQQCIVFDGQIVSVKPSTKEKLEHEKRDAGNMENYIKEGESYTCKDCGDTIMGAKVAHPIWIRGMTGVGSGECQYEIVPYCSNCEKTPNLNGAPVYA